MSIHLKLSIISLQDIESLKSPLLLETYRCWKKIWEEAYRREWNIQNPFYADKLKRHKELVLIHQEDTPIAFFTMNHFFTSNPLSMDDSYFEVWDELSMLRLKRLGENILTMENFTISPDFRKHAAHINFKELVGLITVSRLYHSSFHAIVATPRIKRKVEKEAHRMGAKVIAANIPYTLKDERIDIVYWTKECFAQLGKYELYPLAMELWNTKKIIGNVAINEVKNNKELILHAV